MRQYTITIFLLLIFQFQGFILPVVGQNIHTYVSVDSIEVGDVFTYSLVLNRDREFGGIQFPDGTSFGEDVELLNRERHRVAPLRDSLVYTLQFFGTTDFTIPGQEVILNSATGDTTLQSNPVPLFFKTVLSENEEEFKPFKPIFDFAALIWPYVLAVIFLALAAWYLYRWYKSREKDTAPRIPETPIPFTNPLDELESKLVKLGSGNFPVNREEFEIFYISLGNAIRAYLERVYKIKALEMTSREILRAMQQYPADKEMIHTTRKVLNEADMVKFARFVPSSDQAKEALILAQNFLDTARKNDADIISLMQKQHEESESERVEEINKNLNKEPV